MVFTVFRYGMSNLTTVLAIGSDFLPVFIFSIIRKLVLRSTNVSITR